MQSISKISGRVILVFLFDSRVRVSSMIFERWWLSLYRGDLLLKGLFRSYVSWKISAEIIWQQNAKIILKICAKQIC